MPEFRMYAIIPLTVNIVAETRDQAIDEFETILTKKSREDMLEYADGLIEIIEVEEVINEDE